MKYEYHPVPSNAESRRAFNEKVLYLIDSGTVAQAGITSEDIYNAYTGDGGLHGLDRKDFDNYHPVWPYKNSPLLRLYLYHTAPTFAEIW